MLGRLRALWPLSAIVLLALLLAAPAAAQPAAVYKNVSYGPSPLQTATVFASPNPGATIVVLVHGGGWRLQTTGKTEEGTESKSLQQQGYTVFNVDYDQDSPTQPAFPLETNEIVAATEWAVANAAAYNGDPSKVVLLGGSAGGQLVGRAGELLDAAHPGMVDGIVSLSGPMNLQTLVALAEAHKIKDKAYVKSIEQALGCIGDWSACSPAYEAEYSPALNIPASNRPDWLLLSSEIDTTATSQAEEMLADLQAAGRVAEHRAEGARVQLLGGSDRDDLVNDHRNSPVVIIGFPQAG